MIVSLDAARTDRSARKAAARAALLAWQDAVLTSLELLMAQSGVTGVDPAVVFAGTCADDVADVVEWEERGQLTAVVFAAGTRQVRLRPESGPAWQWTAAVELWDELRTVLGQVYGTEVPVGLVIDLAERVVYCFDVWYCPDIGPEPVAVFELEESGADPADPFELLLASADAAVAAVDLRLEHLLETYQLPAPTFPGHEPGECDLDGIIDTD